MRSLSQSRYIPGRKTCIQRLVHPEERLVVIWQQVLQQERVGVFDNFFDLGGNSLLATRIITHIYQELQVEIPLRSLFLTSTVAAIAEQIEGAQRDKQEKRLPTIKRLTRPPRPSHGLK